MVYKFAAIIFIFTVAVFGGVMIVCKGNNKINGAECISHIQKMDNVNNYYDACDKLAEDAFNNVSYSNQERSISLRAGGLYNIVARDNDDRAMLWLTKASALGSRDAIIDQIAILSTKPNISNCRRMLMLIRSYKPLNKIEEKSINGWRQSYMMGCNA